jgi:hypothetical protein
MCEEPIRNRGSLRAPCEKEICSQFREKPGNCKKCAITECGYNQSAAKLFLFEKEESDDNAVPSRDRQHKDS